MFALIRKIFVNIVIINQTKWVNLQSTITTLENLGFLFPLDNSRHISQLSWKLLDLCTRERWIGDESEIFAGLSQGQEWYITVVKRSSHGNAIFRIAWTFIALEFLKYPRNQRRNSTILRRGQRWGQSEPRYPASSYLPREKWGERDACYREIPYFSLRTRLPLHERNLFRVKRTLSRICDTDGRQLKSNFRLIRLISKRTLYFTPGDGTRDRIVVVYIVEATSLFT